MSTDTKIKTLIFNKLTQEQYNNADRVPTEFYLTPDTSIDSSEKGAANGVASLDTNGKVPTEQIPVATSSTIGSVKPDGTTITVTEDGTISANGGSGSGFDFEGTKAEFDAAVAAGTITDDSVSLITDDVSGDNVATKAELQAVDRSKADTALSNVLANIDYVVESKFPTDTDPSWYRVYKSGWLEQGGRVQKTSKELNVTMTKAFADVSYALSVTACYPGSGDSTVVVRINTTVTTSSSFRIQASWDSSSGYIQWEAKGIGAN